MPSLNDLIKKRIDEAEKARIDTEILVRSLQTAGYMAVYEWVTGSLDTENGKIKSTATNLGRVAGLYRVFGEWQSKYQGTVLGRVLDWTGKIIGVNDDYFGSFEELPETLADKARRLTMQRWGWDGKKLIPGGYFESLFSSNDTAQRVARAVNQAILQKVTLKDFQRDFKALFVGKDGSGMLERHWNTNSFDLYQRIDRTANLLYADELGLNFAIYSGTLEKDSRPFCIARVNRVYSRPEIEAWKDLNFAGKPKYSYDPFTDCGGFNCRHHLSFISDGVAKMLKSKQR
jgi:hypothetical protein